MSKSKKYSINFKKMCTPALLYFTISLALLIFLGLQNVNNSDNILCLGLYKCDVGNKFLVFVIHAIYILFWTFVLDVICKAGYYELSWFIFLLPFLIFFLFLAMIIFKTNVLV